jgi:hypothetical protein
MLYKATLTGTIFGFIFLLFSGWSFYENLAIDFFSKYYVNMPSGLVTKMN